jgi:hypothetical protein
MSKAANRKAARRGAKRVRTPEESEVQEPWPQSRSACASLREKQRALRALNEFEKLANQGPSDRTLTQWWNAQRTN